MTFSMFLFDENVEPKRSQGQRVAAKDLRVLNMARKVGILLAAEAYLLEKEYAKRTTPPQKKHVFFRSGRVFPCHIIMYSYMYIYIYIAGEKPVSAGTSRVRGRTARFRQSHGRFRVGFVMS